MSRPFVAGSFGGARPPRSSDRRPALRSARLQATVPPKTSSRPACCAAVTSGNSSGALSTAPDTASPEGAGVSLRRAERHDGHRELVDGVSPHERLDRSVGKAAEEARLEARGRREGEKLRKHRARIPEDVPVAALAVLPSRPPRDAGDDDRHPLTRRRRSDLQQGVLLRVVPVDPGRQRAPLRHGDVDLERIAATRRAGRSEEDSAAVAVLPPRSPDDAGRQEQEPAELVDVNLGLRRASSTGENGERRGRRPRQLRGQRASRQVLVVPLVRPGDAVEVARLEVLHDARVREWVGPLDAGLVGGQPVQRLRDRLFGAHAPTLPHRPAGRRGLRRFGPSSSRR